jgi:energy-coupling factor transporter ATP-binding protein EcfA2
MLLLLRVQGHLTLLLGPPSCGKTTFLRALAGRLPRKEYSGEVMYNGHTFEDFCAARTAVFVPQVDSHIPNLTALETTRFSYDMHHGPHGEPFCVPSLAPSVCIVECPLLNEAQPSIAPDSVSQSSAVTAVILRFKSHKLGVPLIFSDPSPFCFPHLGGVLSSSVPALWCCLGDACQGYDMPLQLHLPVSRPSTPCQAPCNLQPQTDVSCIQGVSKS